VLSSWNIGRSHVGTENLLLVSLLRARHPEQGLVDRGLCAEQPMTHDAQHEGRRRTRPDRPSRRTRNGHSEQHREPYVHDGNVCDPKRVHALPGNPENVLVWTAAAHFPDRTYFLSPSQGLWQELGASVPWSLAVHVYGDVDAMELHGENGIVAAYG